MPTATHAPTATPTRTPTPTPVPAEVTIAASTAAASFPESIRFRLKASGTRPLSKVELEFGTERVRSCASEALSSVRLDIDPGVELEASWDWEMRRTGSIPPGVTVWWRWRLEDDQGRRYVSPRQATTWDDPRFEWLTLSEGDLTVHWHEGGVAFGEELVAAGREGLRQRALILGGESERPIKAFVYADPEDLHAAVLFAQEWTGGLAYSAYETAMVAISPTDPDSDVTLLAHEMAHLAVAEATFNCIGGIPTWLDEGLATRAQGPLSPTLLTTLDDAIFFGVLISVRSLGSSFPADDPNAQLSYAQSASLVDFLVRAFGWPKMREMLAVFKEGSTTDDALRQVYDLDRDRLDRLWRRNIGAE